MIRGRQFCQRRTGFTLLELLVACALAMAAISALATMAVWNFRERTALNARFLALEAANNALEDARSRPIQQLNAEWAASLKLQSDPWLPEGKLSVLVTPESNEPGLVRVTANVSWLEVAGQPRREVELVGFFAARPSEQSKEAGK